MKKAMILMMLSTMLLCSCGTDTGGTAAQVTETAAVTETTKAASTGLPIEVGEQPKKGAPVTTKETTGTAEVTTAGTETASSQTGSETTETAAAVTEAAPPEESDFTPEQAKKRIVSSMVAMMNSDWEAVLDYSNFGDICRLTDRKNRRPMTDGEILTHLKNGDLNLSDWTNSAETLKKSGGFDESSLKDAVRLTDNEILGINNLLQSEKFNGSNYQLTVTDGYKCLMTAAENMTGSERELAYLYCLCDAHGNWKHDMALGTAAAFAEYADVKID